MFKNKKSKFRHLEELLCKHIEHRFIDYKNLQNTMETKSLSQRIFAFHYGHVLFYFILILICHFYKKQKQKLEDYVGSYLFTVK